MNDDVRNSQIRRIAVMKTIGVILKVLGWIGFGFAFVSTIILLVWPMTFADGTPLSMLQKIGLILACDCVYLGVSSLCYFPGRKLVKKSRVLHKELEEASHPIVSVSCRNCGAQITVQKGIPAVCDYCGSGTQV